MSRLKLNKQLEQSATPGSLPVTDGSNEMNYLVPGADGEVLTIVGGVPAYATPSTLCDFIENEVLPVVKLCDVQHVLAKDNSNNCAVYNPNPVKVKPTGNYTVQTNDDVIFAVGGSTITLPPCNCKPKTIIRDACSVGNVTVVPPVGTLINGIHSTYILETSRISITFVCDTVTGNWYIQSKNTEVDNSVLTLSVNAATTISVQLNTSNSTSFIVDWGDGVVQSFADNVNASHTYGSAYTGNVLISVVCTLNIITNLTFSGSWNFNTSALSGATSLQTITATSGSNIITGDINNIPKSVSTIDITGSNTISGNIGNLPPNLTYLRLIGNNTLAGNILDMPNSITYLQVDGANTLTGNLTGLHSGLTTVQITGSNTISGNVSSIPSTVTILFNIQGSNTITGNISTIPSGVLHFRVYGSNTISGNINTLSPTIQQFHVIGNNTITGDIDLFPNSLTQITVLGSNTLFGNIANLPPNISSFGVTGNNTITGDIDLLPNTLTFLRLEGANTVFGNIANLPTNLTVISLSGNNVVTGNISNLPTTVTQYSIISLNNTVTQSGALVFNNGINSFNQLSTNFPLTTAMVDNILIALAATLPGGGTVNMTGANQPRSVASNAAVTSLTTGGWTVTTN